MRGRRGRRLIVGAALAIGAVWLVSPAGVPLYDGIGFPDEPYRYVDPPAGATPTKKPPGTGFDRSPVFAGTNKLIIYAQTGEQGPQAVVSMPSKSLSAPRATAITVRAAPEAPDSQPTGAQTDGNVYAVTFTANRGDVSTTERLSQAYMIMRATSGKQPGPTFYYRATPTDKWGAIKTVRVGTDIYQSPLEGPGQYVLAFPADSAGSSSSTALIIVLVVVVAAVVGVLLLIRLRRSRSAAA